MVPGGALRSLVQRHRNAGALDQQRLLGEKNGVMIELVSPKVGPQMQPFHAERGVPRKTGTVTYCLAGGNYRQPTIVIDMDEWVPPSNLCIGFARIESGLGVLAAFQPGTSATLAKAETITTVDPTKKLAAK